MSQRIEAPSDTDVDLIARQLIHASEIVNQTTGNALCGDLSDLAPLQRVLDLNLFEPEATYSLKALGVAFGKVFVENNENYDWWMVEDEYGRDPAIRYKHTTLLVFPQTMISKRIEDGEVVDLASIYEELCAQLESIRAENYPGA